MNYLQNTYFEIVVGTIPFISWRLDIKIVSEVDSDKVTIVGTDSPETLYPSWIVTRKSRREEFCPPVAIGEIFAIFFL